MKLLSYIKQWKSAAREAVAQASIAAQFLSFIHITDDYLCSTTLVQGPSMLPSPDIELLRRRGLDRTPVPSIGEGSKRPRLDSGGTMSMLLLIPDTLVLFLMV
ncbi:unnamed protein product [Linum tenue]|uniref:Uncharacterized protein n=1 Tax=Linum tenue TaxID=586396 RepID=A0AAV0M4U9_9ROSI|nr:unnamed protein product [Linum tenue]